MTVLTAFFSFNKSLLILYDVDLPDEIENFTLLNGGATVD